MNNNVVFAPFLAKKCKSKVLTTKENQHFESLTVAPTGSPSQCKMWPLVCLAAVIVVSQGNMRALVELAVVIIEARVS